jgi:hypothetical protein
MCRITNASALSETVIYKVVRKMRGRDNKFAVPVRFVSPYARTPVDTGRVPVLTPDDITSCSWKDELAGRTSGFARIEDAKTLARILWNHELLVVVRMKVGSTDDMPILEGYFQACKSLYNAPVVAAPVILEFEEVEL